MNTTKEITEDMVNEAQTDFCPFGYLDMRSAIQTCLDAGKRPSFIYECVSEFCESTNSKIEDCDPNYCVYDALMQEARNEINELTDFDLCNDIKNGYIDVAGNFMCTSFDYRDEAKNELINELAEVEITDLSEVTQWFLSELGISQDDLINASKTEED